MHSKCIHKDPCKSKAAGSYIHTEEKTMWRWSKQAFEDVNFEGWKDVTTSQGMLAATTWWKKQGTYSFQESPAGMWSCQNLDFGPVKLILNFSSLQDCERIVSIILIHLVCGNFLQQLEDTNTNGFRGRVVWDGDVCVKINAVRIQQVKKSEVGIKDRLSKIFSKILIFTL